MPEVIIPILAANSIYKTKEQKEESRKKEKRGTTFSDRKAGVLGPLRLRRFAGTLAGRHATVSHCFLYRRGI